MACWSRKSSQTPRPFLGSHPSGLWSRVSFLLPTRLRIPHPLAMSNPIIVALDVATVEKALGLAEQLASVVGAFKIGSELFTSAGPDIVRQIRSTGASVFLDLKFHDIPNTVSKAVAAAVQLDVQMLTIHTSGGSEMMRAAERAAQATAKGLLRPPPLGLGGTILTGLASTDLA